MKQGSSINEFSEAQTGSMSLLTNAHSSKARTAPAIVLVSRPMKMENTRKDLPIVMMEQEMMEAINEDFWLKCMTGVTQQCHVAIEKMVVYELGLYKEAGFQVRHEMTRIGDTGRLHQINASRDIALRTSASNMKSKEVCDVSISSSSAYSLT
ncbi:hypothetical protein AgCh_006202 [Apium graveolens]